MEERKSSKNVLATFPRTDGYELPIERDRLNTMNKKGPHARVHH